LKYSRWLSLRLPDKKLPLANLYWLGASLTVLFSLVTLVPLATFWLQLASHFRWQYLLASLLLFAASWMYRRPILRVMLGISLIVNLFFILPWYTPFETNAHADSSPNLKLLQLNVLSANQQYQSFKSLIHSEQPDVILLQEVNLAWAEQLSKLTKDYPYALIVPRQDNFGIALLSRLPDLSIRETHWGPSVVPSIHATVMFAEQAVQIAVTHPLPPVNKSYAKQRNQQIAEIARWVTTVDQPVILAGDFNLTMWSPAYRPLSKLSLTNVRQGFGILATWPAAFSIFGIPIDHILVSQHFQVTQSYTGPNVGSDHLPLITQVTIKSH